MTFGKQYKLQNSDIFIQRHFRLTVIMLTLLLLLLIMPSKLCTVQRPACALCFHLVCVTVTCFRHEGWKAGRLGRMPAKMAISQHALHTISIIMLSYATLIQLSSQSHGPIYFLAGWRKRRGDRSRASSVSLGFGFFVLCIITVSLVCLDYFAK